MKNEWVKIIMPPILAALLTGILQYVSIRESIATLTSNYEHVIWRLNRIDTQLDRVEYRINRKEKENEKP